MLIDRQQNHIAHHLLTLYALGCDAATIKHHYINNKSYQRPNQPIHDKVIQEMHDPAKFQKFLGQEDYYHDYLVFFQSEIDAKGWPAVINEYCFARDERSDDMLVRLFSGFLHPLIHLGFGIEFKQPAIIAEALAQAAVHDNWIRPLYFESEKGATTKKEENQKPKSLVKLLDEIHDDEILRSAPHWEDGNKIRDGILKRAPDQMIHYLSQFWIEKRSEQELERKTAEMIDAAVYYTTGAQRPPKIVKIDFYFMHCVNCSIFFPTFLRQDWLKLEDKARLLEWKARTDLAMYASRKCPDILVDEVVNYKPKISPRDENKPWAEIFERVKRKEDDGHSAKFVRALAHGKHFCKKYELSEGDEFKIKGDMWDKVGHMAIDSVEDSGATWARSVGFDDAWREFTNRPSAML